MGPKRVEESGRAWLVESIKQVLSGFIETEVALEELAWFCTRSSAYVIAAGLGS